MKLTLPMQIVAGLIGATLIGYLGVLTWNAVSLHDTIGRPPDVRDTISITGEGKVTSKPDVARLTVGVVSEGLDVKATQDTNTKQVNTIIDALEKLGIAEDDIQTSNYQIYPQYDYVDNRQTLRAYQVSQSLTITIRDLAKIGDVLSKAGELGSNQVYGMTFDIDDPSSLEKLAREQAIKDAQEKADALADALGVRVVRVVGFYEDGGSIPPTPYYAAYTEEKAMGMGGGEAPDVKPGSFDVLKNVTLTFEIR